MKTPSFRDDLRSVHQMKLWAWLITQVVVPLALLTATSFIAGELLDVDFAFQKTFAGADVILIGALLFAGIVIDIYCGTRLGSHWSDRRSLDLHFLITLVAALMFFFFYACIKVVVFQHDFPDKTSGMPIDHHLNVCAWVSVIGGILALIWSIWTNFYIQIKLLEIELEEVPSVTGSSVS